MPSRMIKVYLVHNYVIHYAENKMFEQNVLIFSIHVPIVTDIPLITLPLRICFVILVDIFTIKLKNAYLMAVHLTNERNVR